MHTPLRLVLDTNIWLDWLVFDDAGIAAIRAAVESGAARVFIDAACEQELIRVLAYARRNSTLCPAAQAACMERCRKIATVLADARAAPAAGARLLPPCRDPDDQKFLRLAQACNADFLITRDRALLELAPRVLRAASFRIVTPVQYAQTADMPRRAACAHHNGAHNEAQLDNAAPAD